MSRPLGFTRAVPEVDGISFVLTQESFHSISKWYNYILEEIDIGLKNLASSRDGVSEDNNIAGVVVFHGRYKANMNSHESSFDRGNIHCLDFELFSDRVISLGMCYGYCYIGFFDSTVSNNSSIVGNNLRLTKDLVKTVIFQKYDNYVISSS